MREVRAQNQSFGRALGARQVAASQGFETSDSECLIANPSARGASCRPLWNHPDATARRRL